MPHHPESDLGKISCSLRGSVVAGSWHSCVLKYTAGFSGIDDTGSIKIVSRYATDSGTPQFDDPGGANYTTAVASNGAHLQLRYDPKDNRRPWGKTILVKVLQGYLRNGDTITLTLGDTSAGSPGWLIQTFVEDTFELRVLVDRYATYVYEQLPKSPVFRIVAGQPVRLIAVAPSTSGIGTKIRVRWKLEDLWGNPVGKPRRLTHRGFDTPGVHRIMVTDRKSGLSSETNPIIVGQDPSPCFWADLHGQSEETIGTNSIQSYFRFARDVAFLDVCSHQGNDFQITDSFWDEINQTTASFDQPGRFVAFPGWEWSGNTGLGGDRNVVFRNENGTISRSSRALVEQSEATLPCSSTVTNLFQKMKNHLPDVMLVPHVGGRYADLRFHDPDLEPVVEVHSAWGTFEWMLEEAFSRGHRAGIVANSDGHKGRPGASYPGASTFGSYGGLTGIVAKKLDRDSIWDAYQNRRVFATTGARIHLQVESSAGHRMGEVVTIKSPQRPSLRVQVAATGPIERLEIRNGMRVIQTFRPAIDTASTAGRRLKLLWQGASVRGRGRQVIWDGSLDLSNNWIRSFQPINFWNMATPPEPRQEVGSNRPGSETSIAANSGRYDDRVAGEPDRQTQLRWHSITTGGVAGFILELAGTAGSINVQTTQKSLQADIGKLDGDGQCHRLDGVGKVISLYRLPDTCGDRELDVTYSLKKSDLHAGDNPVYACLVQEDGHMAWSSPIYWIVKEGSQSRPRQVH